MAAIFDMDGLLLDTDPLLWVESMYEVANSYHINITPELLKYTRGLRIYEVTEFWKQKLTWSTDMTSVTLAEEIIDNIIHRTITKGNIMPGALQLLNTFKEKNIKMAIATSSPKRMADALITHFGLNAYFENITSADTCNIGKPHPEVYLQCAASLHASVWDCIAFEDSINGMIAAKAAKMQVVVVPEHAQLNSSQFGLADLVLSSLEQFQYQDYLQLLKSI